MDGWTLVCFVVVVVIVVVIVVVAAVITVAVFVNPVVVILKGVGLRLTSAGLSKGLSGLLSVRALRPKQCPPARVHLVLVDAGVLNARKREKKSRKREYSLFAFPSVQLTTQNIGAHCRLRDTLGL